MATIKAILRKYTTVKSGMNDIIRESFESTKNELADFNRDQLNEGFDSQGNRLKKYRNKSYAIKKNSINPLPGLGNPDLRLTGSFHKSIFIEVVSDRIKFFASDKKAKMLEQRYGLDLIYGHNLKTRDHFVLKVLRPAFIRLIKDKIRNS